MGVLGESGDGARGVWEVRGVCLVLCIDTGEGRERERDDGYGEGGLWWMDEEEGRIEGMMRGMDGWMYMRGG